MKKILLVLSSPRGMQSHSHQIAQRIVEDLRSHHAGAEVVVRDVARKPLPYPDEAFVNGLFTPPEKRTPAELTAIETSDALVDELAAADIVVLAVPMHNFGLPAALKSWIDHVVRAGRTFSYSADGAVGLLKGKKAILVVSRGGIYSTGPMKAFDFQESYLRSILGFIGISDVHIVRVEGVAMGADALTSALSSANAQAEEAVREIA
ncbi:MAG: FMN-dependent NADH-azoreductase [Betaproteobacteria bacterium]